MPSRSEPRVRRQGRLRLVRIVPVGEEPVGPGWGLVLLSLVVGFTAGMYLGPWVWDLWRILFQ